MARFTPAIDAFLVKLRTTERTWVVRSDGSIRNTDCECPMEGVTHRHWMVSAHMFGLTDGEMQAVIDAADWWPDECANPALRAALLDACGLPEPEGAR